MPDLPVTKFRALLLRHGDLALQAVAFAHVWLCPFTKVEESFNLQACHDILYHGDDLDAYDHLEFPGVVPRTFLGPAVVSALAYPSVYLAKVMARPADTKWLSQMIVRCVLASLVVTALNRFRESIRRKFGDSTHAWHTAICLSQFHLLFYAGRPLPNTFALVLALMAIHYWMEDRQLAFVIISAIAIVVFRAELAIFLGTLLLMDWVMGRITLLRIIPYGSVGLVLALGLTVPLDTVMWRHDYYLWPEGYVLYYNVILNMSHHWGTMPWRWYFASALPRALAASLPFVLAGGYLDRKRSLVLIFPCLVFVTLYSFLPHKELRFIIYVIPVLNVAAAEGCKRLFYRGVTCREDGTEPSLWRQFLALTAVSHVMVNLSFAVFMVYVSRQNYPGGHAFQLYHERLAATGGSNPVSVHIDNYPAQTGVSRFGQTNDNSRILYDKTEGRTDFNSFDHLIMERNVTMLHELRKEFRVLAVVPAYSGIYFNKLQFPFVGVTTKPAIAIMERIPSHKS